MMRYLALAVLISLLSLAKAPAIELFRYTLTMPDGREFEYVFETGEQVLPETIDRDEAEEIAMEWIMSFHGGPQVGSIESATLRQKPIPHWLVAFADSTEGPIQHLLFAVVLPNGVVVVPKVGERL
jgi:hypothetical protein